MHYQFDFLCALCAFVAAAEPVPANRLALLQGTSVNKVALSNSLPEIFGKSGGDSPVPPNVAEYMLDLEAQGIYLHYYGDQQLFSLAFSPALKTLLQSGNKMPVVYNVDTLSSQGVFDWAADGVPRWSDTGGADAQHVFYGREIRDAKDTQYGNVIHLSLAPEEDPEGWTKEEMQENRQFSEAIAGGKSVGEADQNRQFRNDIAAALGSVFADKYGEVVTTKAHRFALQMYSADSQSDVNNPGGLFFEKFPEGRPPTAKVVFFEAEDGCKGTPTPNDI